MSDWVQKKAAELLGLTKRVLNYKIQRHAITHPQWRRERLRGGGLGGGW